MIQDIFTDANVTMFLKSAPVELNVMDDTLSSTISDMLDTVIHHKGFGLSAPQIGDNRRIIIVLNSKNGNYEIYINPVILCRSKSNKMCIEASLSRPGILAKMKRSKEITVEAYDIEFNHVIIKAKGGYSAIFQHQIDYLDGKLIGSDGQIKVMEKDGNIE